MSAPTAAVLTPEKYAVFARYFREFASAYPYTPQGERRLQSLHDERAMAQRRFAEASAAADRGEDVTDLMLLCLLTYASATPRRRGAGADDASALVGEIKGWFAANGWVAADDWPRVSVALLEFFRRCVADPDALESACVTIAAIPGVKGLQAGTLSPMLHALRSDAFFTMDRATRRVINAFAGTAYRPHLADYFAANATAQRLMTEASGVLSLWSGPALPASDLLELFAHWLITVQRVSLADPGAWRVSLPDDVTNWETWQREGYVALEGTDIGDLATMREDEFRERITDVVARSPELRDRLAALWPFAHQIREGDTIVIHRGPHEALGLATVVGPYYFIAGAVDGHRLPVHWRSTDPITIRKPGWKKPLSRLDRANFAMLTKAIIPSMMSSMPAEQGLRETPGSYHVAAVAASRYTVSECAAETSFPEETVARWVRALDRLGQAILTGPPGTGKTFTAERLARVLIGEGDGFVEMVQFHPAYSYEDFIQGLRPQPRPDGGLNYALVPGRFLEFCERSATRQGICVLIIDELNRANVAQVFGEVLSLLEYRERTLPLASGGTMRVPKNVRIIATMNTADRSIALVDHALRRRFAFFNIHPNYEALRRFHAGTTFPTEPLIVTLQQINGAIGDPRYALGISYFLRLDLANQIEDIWRLEVEPALEELFFDHPESLDPFRWAAVQRRLAPSAKKRSS